MAPRFLPAVLAIILAACAGSPSPVEIHRQSTTDAQEVYFADGVIDAPEYRRAVESTLACVQDQGFGISAELADDGYYQYATVAASGFDAAFEACRNQFSREVELAYQESQGPTEAEMPAVLATIRCLRDADRPPTSGIRPDQLLEFIGALPSDDPARACSARLSGE